MQLIGIGGNIPQGHIFNISAAGLHLLIKPVPIILAEQVDAVWISGDRHLFSDVGENIQMEGMDTGR